MTIPALITAGDTVKWSATSSQYPSSEWTRTVAFRHRNDNDHVNVTGVASGDGWDFTLSATQTSAWPAGDISWQDYVTKSSERYTLATGTLIVGINLAVTTGSHDARSQAEKDLAAVQAAMRAIIDGGAVQEYSIGSRSLKKMSMPDLIALESKLKADVTREKRRAKLAAGLDSGRAVFVRF
jgi:hypothetical protein